MSNLNFGRRRVKIGTRRPKSQHGKCNDGSVRKKVRPGTAPSRIKQRQTFYNIHEFEKTEEAQDDDAYSIFSDSMASEKTVVRIILYQAREYAHRVSIGSRNDIVSPQKITISSNI